MAMMRYDSLIEVDRSTLREAATESVIEAVGPSEFHELDLKQWRCVIGCPRCLQPICLSHYFERTDGGISLPNDFRCQVCGFRSDIEAGDHTEQPNWKQPPGHLDRLIEARRAALSDIRPDLDLPDVATATNRGKAE